MIYLLNICDTEPFNILSEFFGGFVIFIATPETRFPFEQHFGRLQEPLRDEVLNGEENLHFCPNVIIAINIDDAFFDVPNHSHPHIYNSNKAVLKITK